MSDREAVTKYTSQFPPYSDFNFTSLCAWNIEGKIQIAELNNNLVVLFADYMTGEQFLSFTGSYNVAETASMLIDYSTRNLDQDSLRLIPEPVAKQLCCKQFTISEDRDAFDYIYSTEILSNLHLLSSNKHPASRHLRLFLKNELSVDHTTCALNDSHKCDLESLYIRWAHARGIDYSTSKEYKAFKRILNVQSDNLLVQALYIDGTLCAFQIFETASPAHAVAHFCKADLSYKGIYEALLRQTAIELRKKGVSFLNFEQDMGLANLRQAKEKFNAHFFLKKYAVKTILKPP